MFGAIPLNRIKMALAVALLAITASAGPARAEDSNRNEVRANLSKDGWRVIWGKNFTEADWAKGTAAIAASIAGDNPGPFLAWFEQAVDENFAKIQANLSGVTRRDLEQWVVQSLKEKRIITFKGLQIDAGFATYNRWERTVVEVPDGVEFQGIKSKVKTKKIEKTVPLPNWNQFYIRYKLTPEAKAGGGNGGKEGQPLGTVAKPVRIEYTILNDSKETVKFRLPSGRDYSLKPGERESFRNTGEPGAMKIFVYNSGREYTLTGGDHKFWWMQKERRIGLDLNYRK